MPASITSAAVYGIDARPVTVEVDVHRGLPAINIVGLPDTAVQEARERIRSAIRNSGGVFPGGRVTVNLSPADWRKEGSGFDVPAAVAVLVATEQVPDVFRDAIIVGELGLTGDIRATTGILSVAELAVKMRRVLIVPAANAAEAILLHDVTVRPFATLEELIRCARNERPWPTAPSRSRTTSTPLTWSIWPSIRGQEQAKRAMVIAAAGEHNLLMSGPPGSGKTMLANGLRELLPPLAEQEAIEVTKIHSVAGQLASGGGLLTQRPFRQPHHTASVASLVGGGRVPRPGELSLAHHGVLFMDEFPEFSREHLESLRQPLERGRVVVSRVAGSYEFPASVMLIGAMNPCPCGYMHDATRSCSCSTAAVHRYQRRISGPILDRFDIFVHVPRVPARDLDEAHASADPRPNIAAALQLRQARQQAEPNSRITPRGLRVVAELGEEEHGLLLEAMERLQFSMRVYHRVIRVSRTIADLDGSARITTAHIAEALHYRPSALIEN